MKAYRPSLYPEGGGIQSRLAPDDVVWIRKNWVQNGGGLNILDMARRFKVRERTISDICFCRIFKDIT